MNTNTNIPTPSKLHAVNRKAFKGSVYKTVDKGVPSPDGTRGGRTVCPTTGRRFVARIHVTSSGFMVTTPMGGSVQQYEWRARGGREELLQAAKYLAKYTLVSSYGGRYGSRGFIRTDFSCELPNAALAAWGYDRDNAPVGEVSVSVPYFDVLVDENEHTDDDDTRIP